MVGIDGPGGGGKSTIARSLAAANGYAVVQVDDFYRPSRERAPEQVRLGGIAADFDLERLERQVLAPLARGERAVYDRYDWKSDCLGESRGLTPLGVVIVEGVYSTSGALTAKGPVILGEPRRWAC